MKRKHFFKKGLMVLLLFAACSPISGQALKQVDTTATFQKIREDPDSFLNKTVLWGGVIIQTTVHQDGSYIKVLETRLNSYKEPKETRKSGGRFIVYNRGFLDPAIYKNGTRITVIGKIIGKENLPIGDISYMYPVIEAKNIHIWKPEPRYWDYPYPPPYPYGWGWWW